MSEKPEALRLADQLQAAYPLIYTGLAPTASAELRRLHAENEGLRESVKKANAQAEHFERFAALVAAAEREACALICDERYNFEASRIAHIIRSKDAHAQNPV